MFLNIESLLKGRSNFLCPLVFLFFSDTKNFSFVQIHDPEARGTRPATGDDLFGSSFIGPTDGTQDSIVNKNLFSLNLKSRVQRRESLIRAVLLNKVVCMFSKLHTAPKR